ncbi:hypothetical protein BKA59DRAFT_508428 [Fusarium tricinctum]|uniref:Uncharacterized protein n=1 Tax=Fusarium tricinctum TaxID=61284 RepID=A0A8K0S740_9HYPO|nr:hypothetical protein BKA59DRAFT_508428 [Fusarium tricinctum]
MRLTDSADGCGAASLADEADCESKGIYDHSPDITVLVSSESENPIPDWTVGYYYDDSDEDDESDEENEPTATRDDNNTDGTGQYRLMRRAQVLAMGAFAFAYLRMRLEQRGQELLATAFTRPLCHVVFVIIFTAFGLGFAAFAFAAVAWCSNTGPVCKYTTFAPTFAFGYMVGENIVS